MVHTTGWLKGLRVTADGTGIVLHAGVALIRVAQVAPDNRVVWFCAISASACTDTTGSMRISNKETNEDRVTRGAS